MRPRLQRLVPLLFVLLSLFLSISAAAAEHDTDRAHSSHKSSRRGSTSGTGRTPGQNEEQPWKIRWGNAEGGANPHQGEIAYNEAMTLLHQIKPASAPWWKFEKRSGILGSSAYYAKEIFVLLFMNKPPQQDLLTNTSQPKKLGQPLAQAVKLLDEAAGQKNQDALFMLAELNFYGNFTHPRNYSEAFRRYHELATLDGNSSAQHMVGFMYATGIGGAVKPDQARAMLYHTLAAEGGNVRSEMTVAYRHSAGISTPRNCEEAVHFYKDVAKRAMAYIRSGPPGGHWVTRHSFKIADETGGVYGEGASAVSSGQYGKSTTAHADGSLDDVVEYMDLQARKGDPRASFNLAKLNYDGSRTSKQDLPAAKKRFLELARMYWTKEGKIRPNVPAATERLASKAAGYLGRMFLRGEGMPQSYDIAKTWFKRGIDHGDAMSQYLMGLMYLEGLGVPKNAMRAAELFAAAADQDLAIAQVRMGALFLDQGDVVIAIKYFELAARHGHLEAFYYLAELTHNGVGRDKSCPVAAAYYKIVAEKAEFMSTSFPEANEAYDNGDLETALVGYMMAAEQGFESGQANVAFLLDQVKPRFTLRSLVPFVKNQASLAGDAAMALIYWTRSAEQKNVDAMVKMGDYYLHGLGTSLDEEKAAQCYQAAAETMQSAQAMWNLGWMHENGIGIDQDFHLAKRHYDMALETNPREAYLPVLMALWKLRWRSWWNNISGGKIKSIQEEPAKKQSQTLTQWLAAFLEAELADYDFEQQYGTGDDDYYDDADIDSDILESLIILALSGALAFLLYYRTQRQRRIEEERRRRELAGVVQGGNGGQGGENGGQGVGGGQDRGVFPQPGDPAFMDWVAGGVGH